MNRLVLLVLLLSGVLLAHGQQEQQYSLYMINPYALNPAIGGTEDFVDLYMGFRNQWTGFEGAPYTAYMTGHMAVGKEEHQYHHKGEHESWHGVGAQFYLDQVGPLKRTAFLASYAFNMPVTQKARLSVGTFVGFKQLSTNADYWRNIDDMSDANFSTDLNSGIQPDLSLGLSFYHPSYYVNISTTQMFANRLDLDGVEDGLENTETFKRHYFMSTGYKFRASQTVSVMPSTMLKYVPTAPLSVDLNLKMVHDNKYWYGFSYRVLESFNGFAGMQVTNRIDVTYAFEWSTTRIGKYISGTHEIVVALRLQHPKAIECPSRYW